MQETATRADLSALGRAALAYAARGLAVFPLAERSKVPAIAGGFKEATTDAAQLRAWWEYRPQCNIGIATGGASGGLVVIDCDCHEAEGIDGMRSVRAHEAVEGAFPESACVSTPSGGEHLYFRCSEPFDCSVDREDGVDVRADGGYVVAPPSIHPNGGMYEWDFDIADYGIQDADRSVLAFIRKVQGKRRGSPFKLPEKIGKGERNDTIFKLACSMQSHGEEDGVIYAYCTAINKDKCQPPLADAEVEKVVEQALKYQKGEGRRRTPGNTGQVSTMLRCRDSGVPYQTVDNCRTVLENDIRLAGRFGYDAMAYTRTVECPLPWDDSAGTRQLRDSDYINLLAYMEREYMLTSREKSDGAVVVTCDANRRYPVREWLRSLSWDGESRIPYLLPMYLGVAPSDYAVEAMRLWMRGAIARAFEPGCKFDYMLVLRGKQGIGKSSFLRRMAHDPRWFDDNFSTIEGDAAIEKLRGKWMVEVAELLALKKSREVEGVKAFITSRSDTIRPKYARETEQRPRTCVFAGSTNSGSFLTDPTGNRRFLVVECDGEAASADVLAPEAQAYIDQAWAEAMASWDAGERSLVLPRAAAGEAERVRRRYTEDDPRVGIVQEYLARRAADPRDPHVRVCVKELIDNALKLEYEGNPNRRLVNELNEMMENTVEGWMLYPLNGTGKARCGEYGVQRCYVPKKAWEKDGGAWRER